MTAPTPAPETYQRGPLAEGMVLTVEPGLYFQPDDETVPPEFRGIGVRIEDDVLVTAERMPGAFGRAAACGGRGRGVGTRAAELIARTVVRPSCGRPPLRLTPPESGDGA